MGEISRFAHSVRVVEHVSTTKTTHSTSILRLVAQHLLLQMHSMSITPECYSGILVKNTPSFRKGLGVGYICRFLRFSFSFTSLIPCLLPPREEREKTERTTAQLPANKKCCLLIFAIAIGCLVLADFPASSLPVALVHPVLPFPFLLVSCSAESPITLVASWGALCGSAREKSALLNEKSP